MMDCSEITTMFQIAEKCKKIYCKLNILKFAGNRIVQRFPTRSIPVRVPRPPGVRDKFEVVGQKFSQKYPLTSYRGNRKFSISSLGVREQEPIL